MKGDVVTVGTWSFRHEVEQARALLSDHGIDAIIWSDDGGGLYPSVGFLERYHLKVLRENEEAARGLLEEIGFEG